MAVCGHHYPMLGCAECWEGICEESRVRREALRYLEESGAISAAQHEAALDEAERRLAAGATAAPSPARPKPEPTSRDTPDR